MENERRDMLPGAGKSQDYYQTGFTSKAMIKQIFME